MSSPGWYPDPAGSAEPGGPAGAQGAWRWYDGTAWTGAAATGPHAPQRPPEPSPSAAPTPPSTTGRSAPWLGAAAALVAVGLAASQLGWREPRVGYIPSPGPGPVVSASAEPSRPSSDCPVAATGYRSRHPEDDNTYGGRLALPKSAVPYDQGPAGGTALLSSMEDNQTWFTNWQSGNRRQSGISLGEIRREGRYADPRSAATAAAACMASMPTRAADVTSTTTVSESAVTVDGRPGWQTVVDVGLNPAAQLGVTSERLIVVVVDDGRTDWLSALAMTVRLDRPDVVAKVQAVPQKLRVVA